MTILPKPPRRPLFLVFAAATAGFTLLSPLAAPLFPVLQARPATHARPALTLADPALASSSAHTQEPGIAPAAHQPARQSTTPHPAQPQMQTASPAQPAPSAAGDALPDLDAFIKKVRDRIQLDTDLQVDYSYVEKRRDVKVSKLGKVSVGALRTFEVYPSPKAGRTYKRLIAIDGTPLDPAELERRDTAHREHMVALALQEQNETPDQRAKRLKKEADEKREKDDAIDDAFAVFAVKVEGREMRDGHRTIVATLTPRQNAKTKTDLGKYLKKFKARAWVAEDEAQLVHIEATALEDITIGWGLVGRVHDGGRFTFTRRKVNNEVWLPAEATFEASGRTLLFRSFQISTTTTYSDYKKFNVDTSVTYSSPKDDKDQP